MTQSGKCKLAERKEIAQPLAHVQIQVNQLFFVSFVVWKILTLRNCVVRALTFRDLLAVCFFFFVCFADIGWGAGKFKVNRFSFERETHQNLVRLNLTLNDKMKLESEQPAWPQSAHPPRADDRHRSGSRLCTSFQQTTSTHSCLKITYKTPILYKDFRL